MDSFSGASHEIWRALKPSSWGTDHKRDPSEQRHWLSQPSFFSGSTTLLGSDRSPSVYLEDPKRALATPQAQHGTVSRTLRSVASLFYVREDEEFSEPLFDQSPKTPERKSHRSPLKALSWSKSSSKSRRSLQGRARDYVPVTDTYVDPSPKPAVRDQAPVLDVEIPNHALVGERQEVPFRIADIGKDSPQASFVDQGSGGSLEKPILVSKFIWPDWAIKPLQEASLGRSAPEFAGLEDPYLDPPAGLGAANEDDKANQDYEPTMLFTAEGLHAEGIDSADDKGYASDIESNDEIETIKPAVNSPIRANRAFGTPSSSRYSHEALRVHFGSTASPHEKGSRGQENLHQLLHNKHGSSNAVSQTTEVAVLTDPASPTTSRRSLNLRKSLDYLRTKIVKSFTSIQRDSANSSPRLPSCSYDADAELSEPSPPPPSMGSRHEWNKIRQERHKRYVDTINSGPLTESDEGSNKELQLSRSPTRGPLNYSPAAGGIDPQQGDADRAFYIGRLRYAIEAIERRNADEIELTTSASHSPHHATPDRRDSGISWDCMSPETATLSPIPNSDFAMPIDPPRHVSSTTVFRQGWGLLERDLLPSADTYDPYQAALIAAGLSQDLASESASNYAPFGSNEKSVLMEEIIEHPSRFAQASVLDKQPPPSFTRKKFSPGSRPPDVGLRAISGDDISLCDLGETVITLPGPDSPKPLPFRPKPAVPFPKEEAAIIPELNEAIVVRKSAELIDLTTVFEPRPSRDQVPMEQTMSEDSSGATPSWHTPKGEREITLSKMSSSPRRRRIGLQHSAGISSTDNRMKRDYDRFEDVECMISNEDRVAHDEDVKSPQPTSFSFPSIPLKENDPPRPPKENGYHGSSYDREPKGLMRHLEERGARRLMQLVYNLENEAADEDEADFSGSEISRYDTISID